MMFYDFYYSQLQSVDTIGSLLYRGGLTMFARKVMLRTRHACHIQNKMDQVCLPYKFFWGLDMLAMLGILGTMYACHVDKKWDQTCLPYQFCSGPGMPAIFSHRDQVCLPSFQNLKSISCKTRSFPVQFDWNIRFAFLLRIISTNQI